MGVGILYDAQADAAVMFCSTTDWAFGPVVGENRELNKDPYERVEAFIEWLGVDARTLSEADLSAKYSAWQAQEADQYAKARLADLEKDLVDDVLLDHEVAELAALRARFS